MINVLTVDVEEWYHGNLAGSARTRAGDGETRLERNIGRLLDLFEGARARATFFVVGSVAARKPSIPRMIEKAGHHVALHGWDHELLHRQTVEVFQDELHRSIGVVGDATGAPPRGFRAPSWSMTVETGWAWEVMERAGLDYDASVCPFRTFLYGMPGAPRYPYHPRWKGRTLNLLEIPVSTVRILGVSVPFSGGFYLRILPAPVIHAALRRVNVTGHPAIVYVHPWEVDPGERRQSLGTRDRFIQYVGVSGTWRKLERLLASFEFMSIEEALDAGLLHGESGRGQGWG